MTSLHFWSVLALLLLSGYQISMESRAKLIKSDLRNKLIELALKQEDEFKRSAEVETGDFYNYITENRVMPDVTLHPI